MVPFQKMVKINQQKWYHFRQKRVKIPQQKWYNFRKGSIILDENGTISEEGQTLSTKMVPFHKRVENRVNENSTILVRKGSKFLNKNGTISEKGQKSSTKMVPFQKRVKYPQQKWYHFSHKMIKIPQQKWYYFRKGSKILNRNGTISENGQNSSTKWYHFRQ